MALVKLNKSDFSGGHLFSVASSSGWDSLLWSVYSGSFGISGTVVSSLTNTFSYVCPSGKTARIIINAVNAQNNLYVNVAASMNISGNNSKPTMSEHIGYGVSCGYALNRTVILPGVYSSTQNSVGTFTSASSFSYYKPASSYLPGWQYSVTNNLSVGFANVILDATDKDILYLNGNPAATIIGRKIDILSPGQSIVQTNTVSFYLSYSTYASFIAQYPNSSFKGALGVSMSIADTLTNSYDFLVIEENI